MKKQKADFVDVRADAQKVFNAQVQKSLEGTVWASGCTSWYQQDGGKNFAIWPGYTWRYWLETRKIKTRDYVFGKAKKSVNA
jgi:hypothetical protein